MGLGLSSADAAEYYRAIELQKMQIKLTDGTKSESSSASKRNVDLTKSYADVSIAKIKDNVNFLESTLDMSAQIGAGGIATVSGGIISVDHVTHSTNAISNSPPLFHAHQNLI